MHRRVGDPHLGVKESFRSYISGTIARGQWQTTGDAAYATPAFTWSSRTGTAAPSGAPAEVSFTGGIRFTGHDGLLDTTLADPTLVIDQPGHAVLRLDVSGVTMDAAMAGETTATTSTQVPFVDIDLSGATTSVDGDTVTINAAEAPTAITAEGFAEVHSTPHPLGQTFAGPTGRFTVSGTLPADFPAGAHTVVAIVDGVTVASTSVTVAAAAAPAPVVETAPAAVCTAQSVSGASISWGVKESFVSYVGGAIAKGSANIGSGSGSGSGSYNTDEALGRVNYGGSATFTGHGGILNLTLANPTIQVQGSGSATLSVSANGSRVVIANLSLPAASVSGGEISWRNAAATLTSAGASLFSYNGREFYPAGTPLDPVSFTWPLGAEVPCDASTSGELAATGGHLPDATGWIGLGMLVLGAGLVALRRRRALVG